MLTLLLTETCFDPGARLNQALKLVGEPIVFADIGCDHAYAACAMALKRSYVRVIACDSSRLSLKKAAGTMRRLRLESRVELRLGSGLEPLALDEADTVLIAGMGALRIIQILEADKQKARSLKRIVLCPHGDTPALRKYLLRNGYSIEREALIFDNKFFYEILQAHYTGKHYIPNIFECEVGTRLFDEPDKLLEHYLQFRIMRINQVIESAKGKLPAGDLNFKLELRHTLEVHLSWLLR